MRQIIISSDSIERAYTSEAARAPHLTATPDELAAARTHLLNIIETAVQPDHHHVTVDISVQQHKVHAAHYKLRSHLEWVHRNASAKTNPGPKPRDRPPAAAQRAKFAKKVHIPPFSVNDINFELNGFNASIWVSWSPSDPKKLWCTDRSIQIHKICVKISCMFAPILP